MPILRRLLGYLHPHRRVVGWLLFTTAGAIALAMVIPLYQRQIIDRVIIGEQYHLLFPFLLALLVFSLGKGFFNYAVANLREFLGQLVVYDLRTQLYAHLERLAFSYYDKVQTGQLMSRLVGDVEFVRVLLAMALGQFLSMAMMFGTVLAILLWLDWRLTLVTLAVSPFLVLLAIRVHGRLHPAWLALHQQMARLTTVLQENITGVRVVKSFAREGFEKQKFAQENREILSRNLELAQIWANSFPLMDFLVGLSATLLIWYGAREVILDRISLGTLVAFNSYLWFLVWPLRQLGWLVNILGQASAAGERLFEILYTRPGIKDQPGAVALTEARGTVSFENVSFSYDGKTPVLAGINLEIPAGATVAIVGPTGSGKSSLVSLVPRFYEVTGGCVRIDGIDVRGITLASLRRQIGLVFQETFLFSASIRENISYGRPGASFAEIVAAARAAQAHDFIMEFPEGYETKVGERGVGLSGGQKQRLALARAILRDPTILILDNPTASVDNETERLIQQSLRTVLQGRTTIIITQRVAIAQNADLVVVLEEGRITEQGTPAELLARGGYYADLYRLQLQQQAG